MGRRAVGDGCVSRFGPRTHRSLRGKPRVPCKVTKPRTMRIFLPDRHHGREDYSAESLKVKILKRRGLLSRGRLAAVWSRAGWGVAPSKGAGLRCPTDLHSFGLFGVVHQIGNRSVFSGGKYKGSQRKSPWQPPLKKPFLKGEGGCSGR